MADVAFTGTGRCYCGHTRVETSARPDAVAICHCEDCRRVTGAALPAFAAFHGAALTFTPDMGRYIEHVPGVRRSFCSRCGSPLAATFDYLPDRIYVPVGLLDFCPDLEPTLICHSAHALPWVTRIAALPHHEGSGRAGVGRPEDKATCGKW